MKRAVVHHFDDYRPEPGDIFACWGTDIVSQLISAETSLLSWLVGPSGLRWSPSHVAISGPRCSPNSATQWWFESTTMARTPCLEAGYPVSGCQVHPIRQRVKDYVLAGGRVAVYRLNGFGALSTQSIFELRHHLMRCVGDAESDREPISYDTAEAILSGTRALKYLLASRTDRNQMFCSELLAALLQELGLMNRANPTRFHPGLLLRHLVRKGTYGIHATFERGSRGLV